MRKLALLVILSAVCICLVATPTSAQGCGTMKSRNVTCSCGGAVSVNQCGSGRSNCYPIFPGPSCGGSCNAASATDEFGCLVEQPSAANSTSKKTRLFRAVTLYVPTCGGEYVAVSVEKAAEVTESR